MQIFVMCKIILAYFCVKFIINISKKDIMRQYIGLYINVNLHILS